MRLLEEQQPPATTSAPVVKAAAQQLELVTISHVMEGPACQACDMKCFHLLPATLQCWY